MRCLKCNHEMKEYIGLFETGWDCTNKFCGNENYDLATDPNGNVVTPGSTLAKKFPMNVKPSDIVLGPTVVAEDASGFVFPPNWSGNYFIDNSDAVAYYVWFKLNADICGTKNEF